MQDCFDFYFYHENEEKMTEEECTRIVHEKLFPTQPPTISTTTRRTTTRPTTRPTTRRPTTRPITRRTTTTQISTKKPTRPVTTTKMPTTLKNTSVPPRKPNSRVFSPEAIYVSKKKTTEAPEILTIPSSVNTELPDDIDDLFMGFTAEAVVVATKKPLTTTKKTTTSTKPTTTTTSTTTTTTTTTSTTTSKVKLIEQPEAKPVQVQPVQTIVIPLNPSRSPIRSPVARSPSGDQSGNQPASDSAFNSVSSPKLDKKTRSKCKNGKSCGSHGKCKLVDDEYTCVCQEKYIYSTAKQRCNKSRRKEKTPKWSRWSKWGQCSTTCDEGVQSRYRKCHLPRNSRSTCPGTNVETRTCMHMKCSEHDRRVRKYQKTGKWKGRKWSKWSNYTPCSKTCGGGRKSRSRTCLIPDGKCPANGLTIQWATCREEPCRIDQIDDS